MLSVPDEQLLPQKAVHACTEGSFFREHVYSFTHSVVPGQYSFQVVALSRERYFSNQSWYSI